MLRLSAFLAVTAVSLGMSGCGGARHHLGSTSYHSVKNDNDNDGDHGNDDINWGHPANGIDMRAATTVVRRYYAAAAGIDGTTACSLTDKPVAKEIAQPEVRQAGGPALPGLTCAAVISKDFEQIHRQVMTERAALKVVGVRVSGSEGIAFLNFGVGRDRRITIRLEHSVWKIDGMLDSPLG